VFKPSAFSFDYFSYKKKDIKVLTQVEEEEEEVEEAWVRPPQPPELRLITLGSKGELSILFSEPIEFPQVLLDRFELDK
jgi:hypothetical protein